MRKTRERLELQGAVKFVNHRATDASQVESLLRRAFEVEDRSWKGLAGSSVLRSDGMFESFCEQARLLARDGQLEISFLELAGEPIAFEYGYRAKGTYFSHKVGYDERYGEFGPGQLLMLELLKSFHADPSVFGVDCLGPLSDAVSRWTTRSYRCGRLILAPRRLLSNTLLATYRAARPWARRLRLGSA
jgi:CelD/BcsL family acetyltransferase involved in cellulose biosynthesis